MARKTTKTAPPAPFAPQDWPAEKLERRRLGDLSPYPANARLHSDEQVDQLAASIQEFGLTTAFLVDEDNVLIYGHGRYRACLKLGMHPDQQVPVFVARGWSAAQVKAYRLADNAIATNATWDEPQLRIELGELAKLDYDISLIGFEGVQLTSFMSGLTLNGEQASPGAPEEPEERELTKAEQVLVNKAWLHVVKEWKEILTAALKTGNVSPSFTRASMPVYFMRALLMRSEIPRAATLPYTPHRLAINGDVRGSILQLLDEPMDVNNVDGGVVKSIAWVCQGEPSIDRIVNSTYPIHGFRLPADFPAHLARDLYDEFVTRKGGAVLDPCHGWGGRALGFLLSEHAARYVGFDVDKRTTDGVKAMVADLTPYCPKRKVVDLMVKPFEDATLAVSSFDFGLTSPPYYDVEKYGGDLSSWRRYKTFDAWVAGFYGPLITKTIKALKPGAVFALQIGNQSHPLEAAAKEIAPRAGAQALETRATDMVNNLRQTEAADGEVILLLRKTGGKTMSRPVLRKANPAAAFGDVL